MNIENHKVITKETKWETGRQKMNIENHKVITKETKRRKHTKRRYRESKDKARWNRIKNTETYLSKYIKT